jgi:hypothetical protein
LRCDASCFGQAKVADASEVFELQSLVVRKRVRARDEQKPTLTRHRAFVDAARRLAGRHETELSLTQPQYLETTLRRVGRKKSQVHAWVCLPEANDGAPHEMTNRRTARRDRQNVRFAVLQRANAFQADLDRVESSSAKSSESCPPSSARRRA